MAPFEVVEVSSAWLARRRKFEEKLPKSVSVRICARAKWEIDAINRCAHRSL
jgi:hypothetical protein